MMQEPLWVSGYVHKYINFDVEASRVEDENYSQKCDISQVTLLLPM